MTSGPYCALLDMDGTLYDTGLDFTGLRRELGLSQDGRPIFDQLRALPSPDRELRIEQLEAAEARGAAQGTLLSGAHELLEWLRQRGIRCALITNNSRRSLQTVLDRRPLPLDLTLSRDDGPMKPDPALFLMALDRFGIPADRAVAIGDSALDARAAHAAGVRQIHLVHAAEATRARIPEGVEYSTSDDLFAVREKIERWLKEPGRLS